MEDAQALSGITRKLYSSLDGEDRLLKSALGPSNTHETAVWKYPDGKDDGRMFEFTGVTSSFQANVAANVREREQCKYV